MSGIETYRLLKPNKLVGNLIASISAELPFFSVSKEFKNITKKKKNENQHSTAFCVYMTARTNAVFIFNSENAQKASYTIDIGVYYGANLIYVIEAKLLPTPEGSKQSPRLVHEYVYGKGAGIQRFKDGFHGVNNEDQNFTDNGMIAYVKEKDFNYWLTTVNQWIVDANWQTSEKLQIVQINKIAALISAHPRKDGTMIRLHHFWVAV